MGLFKFFNKYFNQIAISDGVKYFLTYKKLLLELKKIKRFIKKKSLVLIVSENSIGCLLAYIFCIVTNHVAIIVDSKTHKKDILKIFNNYSPNFIFLTKKNKSIFLKTCKQKYKFFKTILMVNNINKKINLNKNLSVLLPTSGSMGSVKFVKLSKDNLKNNTYSIIKYLKINNKDSAITSLPISYSYMLSIINTHLEMGASIIVSDYSLMEKNFWKIFKKSKVTSFSGVPYLYEIICRLGLENIKINSLRYLTQAGGSLENNKLNKIIKFCQKNNLKFFHMYGQTEASPRISYLNPKFAKKKIGSIGKAIPGGKMYINDDKGIKITKPYSKGEIIYEGKNVFMGYSKNFKDLKNANEQNFKLNTGDLGYFDKDGFFYITGRISRIAKIYGNRIDIEALENIMKEKSYQTACLSNNKKIFIFVEKKYDKQKLINLISKITHLEPGSFQLIRIKKLPRTINNKINYRKLRNKINVKL